MSTLRIELLGPSLVDAFLRLHSDCNGAGWCRCVAWWVPTWEGWGDRTAEANLGLRCDLFDCGEHDGLLAFDGKDPVGWCQVGRRDRLEKLVTQLELTPDPSVWAVTCFLIAPSRRRQGIARALLDAAVDVARAAGATRIEGYPRVGAELEEGDAWTGPESLFEAAGFRRVQLSGSRAVVRLPLGVAPGGSGR